MRAAALITLAAAVLAPSVASAASPQIQHWRTDNGARVYFVAAGALPIVDVRLVFDAGSARDDGHPGLARLTSSLLTEGTPELNAGEIARGFERYGARLSTGSEKDMAWLHLRSLSRPEALEPTMDQLVRILGHASFPEEAVDRVRQQMLVGLRRSLDRPGQVAERAFSRALYRDHPYAHPPEGTPESVEALERARVVDFHQRLYVARNLVIAIVGDLDRAQAETMAERLAASRPEGQAPPELPAVPELDREHTEAVEFRSTQTHLLTGQPAVARGDPRYPALYLANHILGGGGLVSRLAEALREERGLSYSSYSYFAPAAAGGRFVMGTQVRSDAAVEALEVLHGTLDRLYREGPTDEELESARRNITGAWPLSLDSNSDIVGQVAMIGFYDLPLDYLESFPASIAALDREAVMEAFREVIHPQRLVTLRLGPSPESTP